MKKVSRLAWVPACVAVFLVAANAEAKRLIPVETLPGSGSDLTITVANEKAVLGGAKVLVEDAQGRVLAEGVTDSDGRYAAEVDEETLLGGVNVTAAADGHSAVSVT